MVEKVYQHNTGKTGIWQCADDAPAPFFDHLYAPFYVAHVFCRRRGVESCMVNIIANFVEFIIHQDGLYGEASVSVHIDDSVKEETKFVSST